ncbi:MAG: DNA polymerase-3 subunit delta [Gammaproteobacteria bacterium]|jgi:DNA polymerase-3 subunit delta
MQVTTNRLKSHLEQKGLARAYLVFGDEPLQAMESADLIRRTARTQGIVERLLFEVEAGFDWQLLLAETNEMSLFAERRLIEIRLKGRKPDKTGSAVLAELLGRDDSQDIFLVSADRLDRNAQNGSWFKTISKHGVTVQVQQIASAALDKWIIERGISAGLRLTSAAAELIAVRAEGNLLAAAQELDKLSLLVEQGEIDVDTVLNIMVDSARFDVFGLIDVTVAGDSEKAIRMLRGLRDEGTEAVVIGWALNRELRNLAYMAIDVAAGQSVQSVLNQHNVWSSRSAIVRRALERTPVASMIRLFSDSMRLDRIIKGALLGNPWDELEMLCVNLSGKA